MSCLKCNQDQCCCAKIISKTGPRGPIGLTGKTGPQGPAGPDGATGGRIIFESGSQGSVTGTIFPNKITNVGAALFLSSAGTFLLWIDASIASTVTHTVTYYFKKNSVQVGQARTRTLGLNDHISFKTGLFSFVNTDTVEFFISSTSDTATINNATIHSIKQN